MAKHVQQRSRLHLLLLAAALALLPAASRAQDLPVAKAADSAGSGLSQTTYDGYTKPSEKRDLNFSAAGIIHQVNVKEGEAVKAGQVLMVADDRMDRKALEALQVEVQTAATKLEYHKKQLELKKLVLWRKEQMKDAASIGELDEARMDVTLAETQLKMDLEEAQQKTLEAERQKVKVELMSLPSTINGIVEKVAIKEGEVADPSNANRPAVIVVQNDPLQVEVTLPMAVAAKLKVGQMLGVQYPDSQEWHKARITFFDPVANAASGKRLVHLELANPTQRESGWQVTVQIPEGAIAEAAGHGPQANP